MRARHDGARTLIVVAITAAGLLGGGAAQATSVVRTSLSKMAQDADLVVLGRVTNKHAAWNESRETIHTYVAVRVDSRFKGDSERDIVVTVPGGIADGVRIHVPGTPEFRIGEKVFLYLARRTRGPSGYNVVGFFLGKLTVKPLGKTEIVVHGYPVPETRSDDPPEVRERKKLLSDFVSGIPLRSFVTKVRADVEVAAAKAGGSP